MAARAAGGCLFAPHVINVLGGLPMAAQPVFKGGGALACCVPLAASRVVVVNGRGVRLCSAPLAEGKVMIVQGGCCLSGGEGSHGGFSSPRTRGSAR